MNHSFSLFPFCLRVAFVLVLLSGVGCTTDVISLYPESTRRRPETKPERPATEQICPQTCKTKEDCRVCAADKQACVAGVCTRPKRTCPSACQSSDDCKSCASGQTTCQIKPTETTGRCVETACFGSCQTHQDCSSCSQGYHVCRRGQCSPPKSCSTSRDCPFGMPCVNNQCQMKGRPPRW